MGENVQTSSLHFFDRGGGKTGVPGGRGVTKGCRIPTLNQHSGE